MSKIKHLKIENLPYYVTTKTKMNIKIFDIKENADKLLSCIYFGREKGWYLLLSFVIMPDHLHLIVVPKERNISEIIKSIKGYSSRIINKDRIGGVSQPRNKCGSLWQEGYYDYVIDTEEKLLTKARYIEENPVRKGLILKVENYPYSSGYYDNPTDLELYLGCGTGKSHLSRGDVIISGDEVMKNSSQF